MERDKDWLIFIIVYPPNPRRGQRRCQFKLPLPGPWGLTLKVGIERRVNYRRQQRSLLLSDLFLWWRDLFDSEVGILFSLYFKSIGASPFIISSRFSKSDNIHFRALPCTLLPQNQTIWDKYTFQPQNQMSNDATSAKHYI